ncbi:hypothetical protein CHARACLAT_018161 [Characodon lateralis]|uniref:Uncharacterized protein n=1 Tax=Characodon lateralis TaxID=208331 RepID=A0ABU7E285_9TELE|nr:hypothetical protein [Characodon lateralis]
MKARTFFFHILPSAKISVRRLKLYKNKRSEINHKTQISASLKNKKSKLQSFHKRWVGCNFVIMCDSNSNEEMELAEAILEFVIIKLFCIALIQKQRPHTMFYTPEQVYKS